MKQFSLRESQGYFDLLSPLQSLDSGLWKVKLNIYLVNDASRFCHAHRWPRLVVMMQPLWLRLLVLIWQKAHNHNGWIITANPSHLRSWIPLRYDWYKRLNEDWTHCLLKRKNLRIVWAEAATREIPRQLSHSTFPRQQDVVEGWQEWPPTLAAVYFFHWFCKFIT